MKATHTRIPSFCLTRSTVVAHVTLLDLADAWDAALLAAGRDPGTVGAVAHRAQLIAKAVMIKNGTWGDVYRYEDAQEDLADALESFGLAPSAIPAPVSERPMLLH